MPQITVECTYEPRGHHGLEGYQLGERYLAELVTNEITRSSHYRIWPITGYAYYETCSIVAFNKYFKEITNE